MKMNTLIGLLLFGLSFGGGCYLGSTHQKNKSEKELTEIVKTNNVQNERLLLKIDSLKKIEPKIDTVLQIQKVIEFKTDTLVLINKNIFENTDTIKNELREFRNESKNK